MRKVQVKNVLRLQIRQCPRLTNQLLLISSAYKKALSLVVVAGPRPLGPLMSMSTPALPPLLMPVPPLIPL